jgi:hypothetical protein
LVFADDVNIMENNINTTMENIGSLIDAIKKVGLEVNADRTKHILESYNLNARQNMTYR